MVGHPEPDSESRYYTIVVSLTRPDYGGTVELDHVNMTGHDIQSPMGHLDLR